ncbi:hypothetical protein KI387_006032, partial [Taxus chinensis]
AKGVAYPRMVPRECVSGYEGTRLPSHDERKGYMTSPTSVYHSLAAMNVCPRLSAPRLPKVSPLSPPGVV